MWQQQGTPGAALRKALTHDGPVIAPGVTDALMARLVERAGFPVVYMTGAGTSLTRLGVPDLGLITASEMVQNASCIANAVSLPVIADADTGYGDPLNVRRTVTMYEQSGVAGIHLEDQMLPKRCGYFDTKRLVEVDEHAMRIQAAVDARHDDDFMIIARTDALSMTGLDDALARARAYSKAGADAVWVDGITTEEQAAEIGGALKDLILIYDAAPTPAAPMLSADELWDLGYNIVIMPNIIMQALIKTAEEVLDEIKETGSMRSVMERAVSFEYRQEIGGLSDFQRLQAKYGLPVTTTMQVS